MTRVSITRAAGALAALAGAGGLVAVVLAAAGCFSERQAPSAPVNNTGAECRIPVGSPLLGSTRAIIAIRNFSFQPETVHVKAGTTVTWVNCEPQGIDSHTSTSADALWNSPFIPPGADFSRSFDAAGRFDYFCTPHPFMHGVIIVE